MPVAKIYEDCTQIGDPYEVHGHWYVKVDINGSPKEVRYYNEQEYKQMYDNPYTSPKHALGFDKGYVTIFKGADSSMNFWFKSQNAKYNKFFGWYLPSTTPVPTILPSGLQPVKLKWEEVANGNLLKSESAIGAAVNSLLLEPSKSQYIGSVGDKISLPMRVVKAIPMDTRFGPTTLHTLVDGYGNEFTWMTSAKTLTVGVNYLVNGTVKEHKMYKNTPQTTLIRCSVKELEEGR